MRIQDKNKIKNSKLSNGGTTINAISIHDCVDSGDLIAIKRLLAQNPSLLNQRDNLMEQTPLHIAASLDRGEIIKYLVEWTGPQKVELEPKNVYGETPLHSAAKNGCNEAVRMLLQFGVSIDATTNNSMTSLHLAVGYALRSGDNSVVKTLSQYNADFSAKDDEGMMPFNYLPIGIENEELLNLLCQNLTQQINNVAQQISSFTQQIHNTTGYSWSNGHQKFVEQSIYGETSSSRSTSQNIKEINDYDNRMKGKMEEFDYELSKIVGLENVKQQLQKWAKRIILDEKRRVMGINLGPRKPPHMAFLGNPGTGKTTIARILGKLLHSVGVLSSDNFTKVQTKDLLGEYPGETGQKTRKKIEEAMGGILFVDQAYQLALKQSEGAEAVEEIMSEDGLVVIFSGYNEPMKREGFNRRVSHSFQFEDYSCKDLAEILLIKMSNQEEIDRLYGFKLHSSCTSQAIMSVMERCSTEKLRNKFNGGLVDQMLNSARDNLDSRLSIDCMGDELSTITLNDLESGLLCLSKNLNVDEENNE